MIEDYIETKITDVSKDGIEITVTIKGDKVMAFASEIKQAVLDEVMTVLDEIDEDACIRMRNGMTYGGGRDELKRRVAALKGVEHGTD